MIASSDSTKASQTQALQTLEGLETIVYKTDLTNLTGLTVNARYMTAEQFKRLKENITADRTLTSVPLVYRHNDGKTEILSGNHRVAGAIAAGVTDGWVMEIVTRISEERRIAIQLAHNAITGQDDQSLLRQLYDQLDSIDAKLYTGLNDHDFGVDPLEIASLNVQAPTMEEITLAFLPTDAEVVKAFLKRIEKSKATEVHAASLEDYERFFDTLVRTKGKTNVQNSALALRTMIQLAGERLDQLEAEANKSSETSESI